MMQRSTFSVFLAVVLLAANGLAGCDTSARPPGDVGVCYAYAQPKNGKPHFNVVARNVPTLEQCAADLEGLRLHFLTLGGSQTEMTGAYQTKFLFLEREGIFTADSLNGASYLALVRTGDGRLAPPGSAPQQQ
jgi:hypothetical protein